MHQAVQLRANKSLKESDRVQSTPHTYTLVRSARRTIALIVSKDATLIVRAPRKISLSYIENFVRANTAWIQRTLSRIRAKPRAVTKKFELSERFLFQGNEYPFILDDSTSTSLRFDDGFYLTRREHIRARLRFEKWYRDEASRYLSARVEHFAALHGLTYVRVGITSASTRWGSCSASGRLNFSWRLIMAPQDIIDYVVVHELAHTRFLNHSRAFWNCVGHLYPSFKIARAWLRKNGHLLSL